MSETTEKTEIQANFDLVRKCYTQELTIEQYKANHAEFLVNLDSLQLALKAKTVKMLKNIIGNLGGWADSRDKKEDLIVKVTDIMESYFYIGRSVSFTYGEGTYKSSKEKMINSTTSEVLAKFYADRRAEKEAKEKALANPETIQEFSQYVSTNGKESLTPEQTETYEKLLADLSLAHRKEREVREAAIPKAEPVSTEDFKIHETKHSKTGENIFTVMMLNRVDKPTFTELRTKSKQFDGYYSRFTNKHANPPIYAGFNFKTKESAMAFMGTSENAEEVAESIKTETKQVKIQSTSEKMRERGEKMIERAEESMSQDRRTNTHRQAAQAASSEAKAAAEKTFGQKLIKIADGLENGTIKYLDKLNNGKQLEQLTSILRRGYEARTTWSDREAGRVAPEYNLDVNHIKYPYPTYNGDTIRDVFGKYDSTEGMKRDVKRILDLVGSKEGMLILKGGYTMGLVKKTALKIYDQWNRDKILDQIKNYERIFNMGLTTLPLLKTAIRELAELGKGTGLSPSEKKAQELKELERRFIGKKINGFFPTPKPLVETMLDMTGVLEGETILEPSAGLGHIAEAIKERYPDNELSCIEFNHSLWEALEKKGFNTEHENFLSTTHKYDVIFMNPPFENHQDIDHVMHAFSLLKEGGRLVAIMAANKGGRNKDAVRFMEFIKDNNGSIQDNEPGAFKSAFRSTSVNTIMVYVEK
tara:strand:- start:567 stop:2672 length:2106 start_codon:yes stop_codon:yes gene_type:complete